MVYVFLADGFEDIEALAPIDILRRANVDVRTVSVTGAQVVSAHKVTFIPDISVNEISLDGNVDMIVLPGGMPGTLNLEADGKVQQTIDFCAANGKFIAAICAAPSILGHKGLLKGRNATCFPGFEKDLVGAKTSGDFVCVDGNFITAKGAGVCIEFGLKLAELLTDKHTADSIRSGIQCR